MNGYAGETAVARVDSLTAEGRVGPGMREGERANESREEEMQ